MPDFIEFYHLGKLTYTVSTVLSSLEKNPITFIFSLLLSSHDCLLSHFSSISIRYSRALLPLMIIIQSSRCGKVLNPR